MLTPTEGSDIDCLYKNPLLRFQDSVPEGDLYKKITIDVCDSELIKVPNFIIVHNGRE